MQWRDGSSPLSHHAPGTAGRARGAEPAASPQADWTSAPLPGTMVRRDHKGDRVQERPKRPLGDRSYSKTGRGDRSRERQKKLEKLRKKNHDQRDLSWVFMSVEGDSGHSRKTQPGAQGQCHAVTPGGSLQGAPHRYYPLTTVTMTSSHQSHNML